MPVNINLPSLAETEVMSGVLNEMEQMRKVSKILQKDACTIWEARHIFDWAIHQWPSMASHLGKSAKIISDPYFLCGICKVIEEAEEEIDAREIEALRRATYLLQRRRILRLQF